MTGSHDGPGRPDPDGVHGGPWIAAPTTLTAADRPERIVEAYYVLVTYLMPDARLALFVPPGSERGRHACAVGRQIAELNLHGCRLVPAHSVAYLRRSIAGSAVLLDAAASDRSGWATVAGWETGVPVVAAAGRAHPGAAVPLPAGSGPVLVAEALAAVLRRPALAAA